MTPRSIIAAASVGLFGVVGLGTLFGGYFTVHERERAVVTRNGAFSYIAGPGFHLKAPFVDSVEEFDLSIRSIALTKLETFTVDNQHVDVDMTVQYRIPPENVERVFREARAYEQLLASMMVDRMKRALGGRNINELPEQRGVIAREVYESLKAEAARLYGIDVTDAQIVNISYSPAFRAAVDAAAVSKAQVEGAHQKQRQAEVDAATARVQAAGLANAAIEQARGQAESRLLQARAEAEATRLRGEAEALSIAAQNKALSDAPTFVALEQARRWNGALPQQMFSGAPVPFFNLSGPSARNANDQITPAK